MYAERREDAEAEIERFAEDYGAKYPKAVESLQRDQDCLLSFFDFPAEHWQHLRTTNAVESTLATVRLRRRVTKGAGSRTKALLMALKAARHGPETLATSHRTGRTSASSIHQTRWR